jgi:hypothetical protein
MGSLAANMLDGVPVWLMLVGNSSVGKTELLEAGLHIPGMIEPDAITSDAAFLSATGKRDRAKDATGGLLRQIGLHGGMILNDFTSILSLDRTTQARILNVFRLSYSGRWSRPVGSEGGKVLEWRGKLAMFGGSTGEIDQAHGVTASLGERWVYYRMQDNPTASYEKSRRALRNARQPNWQEEMRDLVAAFFEGLDLSFDVGNGGQYSKRRELTDKEIFRLSRIGEVAAICRSAVRRDTFSRTRDIIGVREPEGSSRITLVLGQLLIGLDAIGVREADRWGLIGKVALDSMPVSRRAVLEECWGSKDGVGWPRLLEVTGMSRRWLEYAVEDLEVHGVVERIRVGREANIRITKRMAKELKLGWGS